MATGKRRWPQWGHQVNFFWEGWKMDKHAKAFGMFLLFYVVTKVLVAPTVNAMNLPLIGNKL